MQLQLYGKGIWVFKSHIDFRCGIDGLCHLIQAQSRNPQGGIYIFYNRKKDKIKCLSWHKNGFAMIYKRLEKELFHFNFKKESGIAEIKEDELSWLLAGLEWQKMRGWKELNYDKFD